MAQHSETGHNISALIEARKTAEKIYIGSIRNEQDRKVAAIQIKAGDPVGVKNGGVNAIWMDASNPKAIEETETIKGEQRLGRPIALTLSTRELLEVSDLSKAPAAVRDYLSVTKDLEKEVGSLFFLRVPLKQEYLGVIPKSAVSLDQNDVPWIQSWDPYGFKPTEQLVYEMRELGIQFPGVTSMNISGQPEIVDQAEAQKFCQDKNIPVYLSDPKANPLFAGSYTIVSIGPKGFELVRDGNIPGDVVEEIFGIDVDRTNAKQSKYPQMEFPKEMFAGLNPIGKRLAVLLYLGGHNPINANSTLRRFDYYRNRIDKSVA